MIQKAAQKDKGVENMEGLATNRPSLRKGAPKVNVLVSEPLYVLKIVEDPKEHLYMWVIFISIYHIRC